MVVNIILIIKLELNYWPGFYVQKKKPGHCPAICLRKGGYYERKKGKIYYILKWKQAKVRLPRPLLPVFTGSKKISNYIIAYNQKFYK